MSDSVAFEFSGPDSLPRLLVFWVAIGCGVVLPLPVLAWHVGWHGIAAGLAVLATLLIVGLRVSIVVGSAGITITKSWFCFPYWRHTATAVLDIEYGGDWGAAEGASGVVVKVPGREVVVGSRKSMHYLHSSLAAFVHRNAA